MNTQFTDPRGRYDLTDTGKPRVVRRLREAIEIRMYMRHLDRHDPDQAAMVRAVYVPPGQTLADQLNMRAVRAVLGASGEVIASYTGLDGRVHKTRMTAPNTPTATSLNIPTARRCGARTRGAGRPAGTRCRRKATSRDDGSSEPGEPGLAGGGSRHSIDLEVLA
ncbi:hypothetical protein FSW04_16230 [Baekduia soli]|uniref:Uncharacterized protein n=1 Tax=Baekduia soli TaxID=496014 RepID=A0A5B8U7N8_9ACTN|nr:hypothetical protein [Baekduia soli]QEC48967.1 hypothetical protein FSW04_16230 [Baekduia soli]